MSTPNAQTAELLRSSPSQVQNYLKCPRRWWWNKVRKMPDMSDRSRRDMGTVLHKACEIWLLADDNGRDRKTGQPVDPFPPGWDTVEDKDGSRRTLSPRDAATVKRLFYKGIEEGLLRRLPGRRVEDPFEFEAGPGVVVKGVIDLDTDAVEDHKTTSKSKYALKPRHKDPKKSLADDPKMLCYAVEKQNRIGTGQPVKLRLNYFNKDEAAKDVVWPVEVVVTPTEVEAFRQKLRTVASEMVKLRDLNLSDDDWRQVEGPRVEKACDEYKTRDGKGGCAYAKICSGMLTPANHRLQAEQKPTNQEPRVATMSMAEKARLRRAGLLNSTPAPVQNTTVAVAPPSVPTSAAVAVAEPVVQPVQQAPTAPVVEAPTPRPPWAVAGCQPCKGTGISTKGIPCRPCDVVSERTGGPTSAQYDITYDNGKMFWTKKQGGVPLAPAAEPAVNAAPTAPVQAQPQMGPPPKAEPAPAAPAPASAAVAEPAPEPKKTKEKKPKQTKSEPKAEPNENQEKGGFTLLIQAAPLREDYVDLADVMQHLGAELAAEENAASYYALNAFDRRDRMAGAIPTLLQEFEGKTVVSLGTSQELKAFTDALRPYAARVIVGVV